LGIDFFHFSALLCRTAGDFGQLFAANHWRHLTPRIELRSVFQPAGPALTGGLLHFYLEKKMQVLKNMSLVNRVLAVLYVAAIAVVLGFAPGAKAQSGNVYASTQAQVMSPTMKGVILQVSMKLVQPSGITRTGGAAIGGVLGGLMGNQLSGQGKAFAAVLGTTIGGFVGERAANAAFSSRAQELVIGLYNPTTGALSSTVTVIQPEPFEAMSPNQQVLISNTNGVFRVIKISMDAQTVSYR
jgi:outer membrane lipoprotein SlyB